MFKIKQEHDYLIHKATGHDIDWKGRFFFVKKDSIPNANEIPQEWVLKVPIFEVIFPAESSSKANIKEFMKIPIAERTFRSQVRVQSVEEGSKSKNSSTNKMSSASKSRRSNTQFGLYDMDDLLTCKKENKGDAVKEEVSSQLVLGSKQRKADVEVIDIEMFGGMEPRGVKKKVNSIMQSISS